VTLVPGQKVCYVTDVLYHAENAARIVALARDADVLFIESVFLEAEGDHAEIKQHLTARQAGTLARRAGARNVVPFHFSPRYAERAHELRAELEAAWRGEASC
jgi:ribonuclease Z